MFWKLSKTIIISKKHFKSENHLTDYLKNKIEMLGIKNIQSDENIIQFENNFTYNHFNFSLFKKINWVINVQFIIYEEATTYKIVYTSRWYEVIGVYFFLFIASLIILELARQLFVVLFSMIIGVLFIVLFWKNSLWFINEIFNEFEYKME